MISIIRLRSQERKERICDLVMAHLDELQEKLKNKGQLLYLTKRARHEDVSLFVHTLDPNYLGDFIAESLNNIEHVWATFKREPNLALMESEGMRL